MPRIHLTERTIARLKAPDPTGKQTIHWDSTLRGFGVLCSGATNAKSFIVQRDLAPGRSRRMTIAAVAEMPLERARQEAAELLIGMRRGDDPKAKRKAARQEAERNALTLRNALDAYLAARKDLRPASVRTYTIAVSLYLREWMDKPLRNITADMVEARHQQLHDEIAAKGRTAGSGAANLALRTMRAIWNYAAERDESMPHNPVRRLSRSWYPLQPRTRMVKAEDMPGFYRAVLAMPNAIQRDYVLLLLFTGLRRTEAATLTWDDVDLPRKVLRIPGAKTKAGRKLDLPMSDIVHVLFVARRALGRDRFVFPGEGASGRIRNDGLDRVAQACGVRVTGHDLRRTYITVAESCDISVMALKALVNHAAGSDVTAGYVQMNVERLRAPAERVADELKRLCAIEPLPEGVARLA
jgi:integrase